MASGKKDLKDKRLLIMGGVRPACEVVKEAQKLGVKVLVTDYLENSPAKKLADKAFLTSTTDIGAMLDLCRSEVVDGVFTCYIDSMLPYCEKVCREYGKPFWGNEENIDMTIDKYKFKLACEKAGVPVVPWIKVTLDDYKDNIDTLKYPVVIKPVDNSGSRGVFKCLDRDHYLEYCEKAFEYSKSKTLLVERMMDATKEFSIYYMMNDGDIYLTSMGDRYITQVSTDIAPVGLGMYLPSVRLDCMIAKINPKIENFFRQNKMDNGFVFVQGFTDDENNFYIHEVGYRLNGGFSYKIVEDCCGYNQVQELLKFSLTGSMDDDELKKVNPHFDKHGFIYTVPLKRGTITKIIGKEEVENDPSVVEFCQLHDIGESLNSLGTTAQVFAYIMLTSDSAADLKTSIRHIQETLHVLDENGNDMIWGAIDPEVIKFNNKK